MEEPEQIALGATVDGDAVSFGLFSAHATAVELCLFDLDGTPGQRIPLDRIGDAWRVRVPGLRPGQLYGYRVHGPYAPAEGHRFNPDKLLVDPYARRLSGRVRPDATTLGYAPEGGGLDDRPDGRDSAAAVPKGVVVATPEPVGHRRPDRSWGETLIYEAHVKGLTRLHPDLPEALRGTFAGLGHPAVVRHLLRLGVTAVELLPVQSFCDDLFLQARGLTNYWGYSTVGYFAPEPRFGDPAGLAEAVRVLHEAGIEVILDVVLNHTAEVDHLGPTLSFRGIDNRSYYKLRPDDLRLNWDCTGCGNTLDLAQPAVRRMALDSLRHWAESYGVDGFRFDLAPALARDPFAFDACGAFLTEIGRDPVLSRLKLIAEPWDAGEGGYRLGQFPAPWAEWNDGFRDAVRGFWRGDADALPRLAAGLAGSREVFEPGGRGHRASVNYVTSHDGFTLRDLVTFETRRNEANGEGNRDGHAREHARNYGHEGPTDDPAIAAERARQVRNMLATVLIAQGTPMLLAGDEIGRSQGGNNNPYCQDSPVTWTDWSAAAADPDLPAFVAAAAGCRRRLRALRRERYLTGAEIRPGWRDVRWYRADGAEMEPGDWQDGARATLVMLLAGECEEDAPVLIVLHAGEAAVEVVLPGGPGWRWIPVLDTTVPAGAPAPGKTTGLPPGTFPVAPRSLVLFRGDG